MTETNEQLDSSQPSSTAAASTPSTTAVYPNTHNPAGHNISATVPTAQPLLFSGAAPQAASKLLDRPFLSDAVEKTPVSFYKTANITLVFPNYPGDCRMDFVITKSKVAYSAAKLFGVHIDSDGCSRYLLTEKGVRVKSESPIILEPMLLENIDEYFGSRVNTGMSLTLSRSNEKLEGNIHTTFCGSMRIPCNSDETATISILISLEESLKIRDELYLSQVSFL